MENKMVVEVIYLKRNSFEKKKAITYPEEQARRVYRLTVEKFEKELTSALVCLREDDTDELLRCERTGPVEVVKTAKQRRYK